MFSLVRSTDRYVIYPMIPAFFSYKIYRFQTVNGDARVAILMAISMVSKVAISSTLAMLTTCTTELVRDEKKKICAFSTIVWARIWLLTAPFVGATVVFGTWYNKNKTIF